MWNGPLSDHASTMMIYFIVPTKIHFFTITIMSPLCNHEEGGWGVGHTISAQEIAREGTCRSRGADLEAICELRGRSWESAFEGGRGVTQGQSRMVVKRLSTN